MIRLTSAVAAAALVAFGAPVLAQSRPVAEARPVAAPAAPGEAKLQSARHEGRKVVMLCDTDEATRRSFAREHGAPPVFVSAEQALDARGAAGDWDAPRCMTAREHGRLVQMMSSYAAVR